MNGRLECQGQPQCGCLITDRTFIRNITSAIPEHLFSVFHTNKNKEHGDYCNLSFFLVVLVIVLQKYLQIAQAALQKNPANGLAKNIISLEKN